MKTNKILFIGLSEGIIDELENLFAKERYTPVFTDLENAENIILNEKPSLIAADNTFFQDNSDSIHRIKEISSSHSIPLFIIIPGGDIKPYLTMYNEDISTIITTPILKKDFFNFLDSCVEDSNLSEISFGDDSEPADEIPKKLSDFTGSLILNILAQNRVVKKLLKTKKESSSYPHLHDTRFILNREVEAQLWEALDNSYFRLHYQPVIALSSGRLSGFEALIRIEDPVKGVITPDKFISVAESSAIIFPLGLWIIEESCRQINYWKEKYLLDSPLRININLSAKQFIHPQLTTHIFEIIDRYGIDHNDVGFELTESAFMEDMESANISLLELRSRKFPLYMDDFGTGYSSLSYLMHFPVDIIKIDQSFVKWMHIDDQSETLVKSLVTLAHNLGLKVVAEGVDDESHVNILQDCGCDYAQGYLISRPLAADKAEDFISKYFEKKTL